MCPSGDIWGKSSWSSRQGIALGTHSGKSASRGRKETQPIGSRLNRIPRRAPPRCLLQSPWTTPALPPSMVVYRHVLPCSPHGSTPFLLSQLRCDHTHTWVCKGKDLTKLLYRILPPFPPSGQGPGPTWQVGHQKTNNIPKRFGFSLQDTTQNSDHILWINTGSHPCLNLEGNEKFQLSIISINNDKPESSASLSMLGWWLMYIIGKCQVAEVKLLLQKRSVTSI